MNVKCRTLATWTLSAILFCISSGGLQAQQFRRLIDIQEGVALPYIPTRCGALQLAIMEWGGETRLGSALWLQLDELRTNFMLVAILASQQLQGGTTEQVTNNIVRDVRNIADIYLGRFEGNYAINGEAINGDSITMSDLDYCRSAAEILLQ